MTFTTLTQDIKDWMENDGTEFSNETATFISLAEQRIARDIDPDYASTLRKAVKNNLNILCYDCKFSSKGIKLNNKIKFEI